MAKTITINALDIKSVKAAIRELEEYSDSIGEKCILLAKKLSEKGVEIAKAEVVSLDAVFTGELLESIHNSFVGNTEFGGVFAVVADSSHAIYVELGTGQMGIDKPYPYPLPDGISWNYATGRTIRQNAKTGRYFWFYPGRDGKWHYTEGMPARPFMMHTAFALSEIAYETACEVFGNVEQ